MHQSQTDLTLAATAVQLALKHLRMAAGCGEWTTGSLAIALKIRDSLDAVRLGFESLSATAKSTPEDTSL